MKSPCANPGTHGRRGAHMGVALHDGGCVKGYVCIMAPGQAVIN